MGIIELMATVESLSRCAACGGEIVRAQLDGSDQVLILDAGADENESSDATLLLAGGVAVQVPPHLITPVIEGVGGLGGLHKPHVCRSSRRAKR